VASKSSAVFIETSISKKKTDIRFEYKTFLLCLEPIIF